MGRQENDRVERDPDDSALDEIVNELEEYGQHPLSGRWSRRRGGEAGEAITPNPAAEPGGDPDPQRHSGEDHPDSPRTGRPR
ncbi:MULTISPECIES: hypothetical protein [Streptomycetaceae]|uniref:Uncharacterized protein n=1 Tax=Streptantibioticus cattleyicolor (strain ATCC 35852 / DSM 46488 / JCM 4925 / NBRC 14057 / NRRL 8057) TaxID=1003195 RepID=F8JU35_STREN|nr:MULTISPECIES: hypothetical protein [Streptomycetaceae]AEW93047.1 hypothetical protein SCATT_06760 [Streptantibioticus cattleyicolor NRRL 8057 = DSM 46488]MYS57780.1 hypothetical protein [Streptomyces sp. SID5468]CCB73405.1 protein of unknown function [Streptantibioticus cattleyicolor NRRL 8057 = DSM 46488]